MLLRYCFTQICSHGCGHSLMPKVVCLLQTMPAEYVTVQLVISVVYHALEPDKLSAVGPA
jgi:hypothetical protein